MNLYWIEEQCPHTGLDPWATLHPCPNPTRLNSARKIAADICALIISVTTIVLISMAFFFVIREVTKYRIIVQPIQIPVKLQYLGYSPAVAAQHLVDEVHGIHSIASTTMIGRHWHTDWSTDDFIVPGAGLSLKSVAAYLRDSFTLKSHVVTGELIYTEPNSRVSLSLRINGVKVDDVVSADVGGSINGLFFEGAKNVIKSLDPYFLASYYYEMDQLQSALSMITYIRTNHAGTEHEARAVNLRGILYDERGDYDAATKSFEWVIGFDDKLPFPYFNWGNTCMKVEDYDCAIEKFEKTIDLDRRHVRANYNLSSVLIERGRFQESIERLRYVIKFKPYEGDLYYNLGIALAEIDDLEGAAEAFEKAEEVRLVYPRLQRTW